MSLPARDIAAIPHAASPSRPARAWEAVLLPRLAVLLVLAAAVLFGMGLRELVDRRGGVAGGVEPLLHRLWPVSAPGHAEPLADRQRLHAPMSFALVADGTLRATGSIAPGTAALFEAALDAHGGAIGQVSLHSPGGALDDALAMARVLRRRGIATLVEDGAVCASSCPLVMAGGVERSAGAQATIGLHQFYLAERTPDDPAQAMIDAQMTTARVVRHLDRMGVDPALWLHALDTPPHMLYYLNREEMRRYRLVTTPWPYRSSRAATALMRESMS